MYLFEYSNITYYITIILATFLLILHFLITIIYKPLSHFLFIFFTFKIIIWAVLFITVFIKTLAYLVLFLFLFFAVAILAAADWIINHYFFTFQWFDLFYLLIELVFSFLVILIFPILILHYTLITFYY